MEDREASTVKRRPGWWHRPMWWLNGLAVGLLLLTYLAPHSDPAYFWPLALLAMTFPFQLAVHAFFLLWWLFFRRKRMLLSGMALLLGWGRVTDHVQLFGRDAPDAEVHGTPVKVMSYNVRLFDLYNWSNNKRSRDAIFEMLHREDADILCLQEFFHSSDKRYFRTKDALLKEFRYKSVHESYSHRAHYDQHFGIATFSAYPIVAKGRISFPDNPNNLCIWSDILIAKDTIRVYNAHLASYHFGDADYKFLDALDTDTKADSIRSGAVRIAKRLRRGVVLRAREVGRIAEHIAASPHPVVYCGDMNDVPMSYAYSSLSDGLEDAFVESGRGMGGTYIGKLPNLRIDHILHSPAIASWSFRTLPEKLSDHSPVQCVIAVR